MNKLTKFVAVPIFAVAGTIAFIGIVFGGGDKSDSEAQEVAVEDPAKGMRFACREFIKRGLNDPDSFKAVDFSQWPTAINEDGVVTVLATYRAKNAFGGTITQTTSCQTIREDGDVRLIGMENVGG
jgi:hypothetical protein